MNKPICWCWSLLLTQQLVCGEDVPPPPKNIFHISIAYRTVAIERMLGEVNYFSQQLQLPTPHPIQPTDIKWSHVNPPRTGFGGVITAKNFDFSFPKRGEGKLCYVTRLTVRDGHDVLDLYPELAKTRSLIDSNDAYQLATQWLTSVSVDVPALEQKYKRNVRQWFFWGSAKDLPKDQWSMPTVTSTNKTMLPIFDVMWGKGETPPVKVTILGSTRELLQLRMEDSVFSRRPPLVITNALELDSVPDPQVKHLQQIQQGSETNSVRTSSPARTNRPPPFHRQVENQ
jgi:hypothetical protein